jgi:hypothetical protein
MAAVEDTLKLPRSLSLIEKLYFLHQPERKKFYGEDENKVIWSPRD